MAVPGAVAGLEAAHRAYGRLPWRELLAPAIELARGGVELTRPQAHMHATARPDPPLRPTRARRDLQQPDRLAARRGRRRCGCPTSPTRFEAIAARGAAALYRGERARAIVATVREGGGELTLDDLAAYRVVWRRPVRAPFRGHEVLSNPPPSSGGVLIAYGLALLERLPDGAAGSAEASRRSSR